MDLKILENTSTCTCQFICFISNHGLANNRWIDDGAFKCTADILGNLKGQWVRDEDEKQSRALKAKT